MANFYCEYCGQKYSSVSALTAGTCPRHPNGSGRGKHKLYEGSEQSKYICEYCGQTYSSISAMVAGNCSRHPLGSCKGKHHPFIGGIIAKNMSKLYSSEVENIECVRPD